MTRLAELRAMRAFIDREIDLETAAEVQEARTNPAVTSAARLYNVRVECILLGDRRHATTRARHAAAWLLHEQGMSLATIARILGYSTKAMAFKAIQRVRNDPAMLALLRGLAVAS